MLSVRIIKKLGQYKNKGRHQGKKPATFNTAKFLPFAWKDKVQHEAEQADSTGESVKNKS